MDSVTAVQNSIKITVSTRVMWQDLGSKAGADPMHGEWNWEALTTSNRRQAKKPLQMNNVLLNRCPSTQDTASYPQMVDPDKVQLLGKMSWSRASGSSNGLPLQINRSWVKIMASWSFLEIVFFSSHFTILPLNLSWEPLLGKAYMLCFDRWMYFRSTEINASFLVCNILQAPKMGFLKIHFCWAKVCEFPSESTAQTCIKMRTWLLSTFTSTY